MTGLGYLSQKLNNKFVTFEQKLNETLLIREKLGSMPKIYENKFSSLEVQNIEQTTKLRVVEGMLDNLLQTQNNRFLGLETTLSSSQNKSEKLENIFKIQSEIVNSKFDQMNKSQQEMDSKLINQLNTYREEVKNCSKLAKNKNSQLKSGLSTLLTQMESGGAKMNDSSFQIVAQQQRQPKMVSNSQWTMNGKYSDQLLNAVMSTTKLPTKQSSHSVLYDGNDSIYIMGGVDGSVLDQILVYFISSQNITRIGSLPSTSYGGMMEWDNFGNIVYFGGGSDWNKIYKFDPVTKKSSVMAQLPYYVRYGTSIKQNPSSNTVYILGGYGQKELLSFDMKSLNLSKMTNLSFSNPTTSLYPATSFSFGNDKAYIYGGRKASGGRHTMFELDLNTFAMTPVGDPNHPKITVWPSSVSDGTFGYLIGGYEPNYSSIPTGGIIQFDPKTRNSTFIPIRNFPVQGLNYYSHSPKCAYVKSSNRIYCLGGNIQNYVGGSDTGEYQDEIFYIDLSPLRSNLTQFESTISISDSINPDFFSCNNVTNDLFPHPSSCSSFLGCKDGILDLFSCPSPLIYNPDKKSCAYPSIAEVDCPASCESKLDGRYPHPHDCSLWIHCSSNVTTIFKCPSPLYFHPTQLTCSIEDEANCENNNVSSTNPLLI